MTHQFWTDLKKMDFVFFSINSGAVVGKYSMSKENFVMAGLIFPASRLRQQTLEDFFSNLTKATFSRMLIFKLFRGNNQSFQKWLWARLQFSRNNGPLVLGSTLHRFSIVNSGVFYVRKTVVSQAPDTSHTVLPLIIPAL